MPFRPDRSLMPSRTQLADSLCFAINFSLALFFVLAGLVSIGAGDEPFSFIGGVVFALPAASYATAEWLCWYRQRRGLSRSLGKLNLWLAAFLALGFVVSLGQVFLQDNPVDPTFVLFLVCAFGIFSAYLFWCGWRRVHATLDVPNAGQGA